MVWFTLLTIDQKDELSICDLYCRVFAGPPWFETWTIDQALNIFDDAIRREGFVGVQARIDDKTVGFAWGYVTPAENTPTVNFENMRQIFYKKELNPDKIFYCAELGVDPNYQGKGIGSILVKVRLEGIKKWGFRILAFRTINPIVLTIGKKEYRSEIEEISYDPEYRERKLYLVRLK